MKLIITERQYRKIVLENSNKEVSEYLSNLKDFALNVIKTTQENIGINLQMLAIWGAGVGGVMRPLNEFIENGNFNLNEFETASIVCAVSAILFKESNRNIKELLKYINENGLTETFKTVLEKGSKLKSTFLNFIQSLNMTLFNVTNIMSYAFIIPILPMLWEMGQSGADKGDIKELVLRLISFGLTSVSGVVIKELITKLINRFKD